MTYIFQLIDSIIGVILFSLYFPMLSLKSLLYLLIGVLMFSLVNNTIACTLAWISLGLIIVHIIFSKSLFQKLFDKLMN